MPRPAPVAVVAVLLLASPALAGCLAGGPTVLAGPDADDGHGLDIDVEVGNVSYHAANLTVHVDGTGNVTTEATLDSPHRNASVPVAGWNGTGAHRVRVDDLAPTTTYRLTVDAARSGDAVHARTETTFRTGDVAWAEPAEAWARPGALIWSGEQGCTLGFVFTGPANRSAYALTAGHCLTWNTSADPQHPNRTVRVEDPRTGETHPLGTAAVVEQGGNATSTRVDPGDDEYRIWTRYGTLYVEADPDGDEHENWYADWGLIEIHDRVRPHVSPKTLHWGGPTGMAQPLDWRPGRTLCHYGQGSARRGYPAQCHMLADARRGGSGVDRGEVEAGTPPGNDWLLMVGHTTVGDSGSPIVDHETGRAAGLLTKGMAPRVYSAWEGPTVASILDRAAALGYDLELATAPFDPPPPMPSEG